MPTPATTIRHARLMQGYSDSLPSVAHHRAMLGTAVHLAMLEFVHGLPNAFLTLGYWHDRYHSSLGYA